MFSFLKNSLSTIYASCSQRIKNLFSTPTIDEHLLQELEKILLTSDMGVTVTHAIVDKLRQAYRQQSIIDTHDAKKLLEHELITLLQQQLPTPVSSVIVLVGINGSGKTTCAAKLAYRAQQEGKRVLLVAGDTFRAAATEQLITWGNRLNIPVVTGNSSDPAAVIFTGCKQYLDERYDLLIIDTAGRLQTKTNLMHELEKIKRVITRLLPDQKISILLTIDALLGQNSLQQARIFHEATTLNGCILTKMDSTSKGGIVFAITQELQIPITYIACGEKLRDLYPFDAQEYVKMLLS